jgi:hypothetical protein
VAAELLAGWLPPRMAGLVVVVAGPVVVDATVVVVGVWLVVVGTAVVVVGPVVGGMLVVVDTMLVVVTSVVVGAAVVGAAVVDGLAVVGGVVAVSWVVVAPEDGRAVWVVAPPLLAGAGAVAGRAVVAGPLIAPCSGPGMVDGEVVVVGSRSPVVVVDADVGAGSGDEVGSATPGTRRSGWGWGSRVAEATRAARTAVVSPKTNSSSRQGRRRLARCRGGRVGMVPSSWFGWFFRLIGCPAKTPAYRVHTT